MTYLHSRQGSDLFSGSLQRRRNPLPDLHLADRLLSQSDDDAPLPGCSAAETEALVRVASWAKNVLSNPHPQLGRSGHVCPYVSASIRDRLFLLTMLCGAAEKQLHAEKVMLRLSRYFSRLEPTKGRATERKTIVVLFPDLPAQRAGDVINDMHQRLKPHFLRRGLMLGEFYQESSKPGLHNADFRPLRSHTPLLVIRSMLLADLVFLTDRCSFVRPFIEKFGARGCSEARRLLEDRRSSLTDAEASILLEEVARYEAAARVLGPLNDKSDTLSPART